MQNKKEILTYILKRLSLSSCCVMGSLLQHIIAKEDLSLRGSNPLTNWPPGHAKQERDIDIHSQASLSVFLLCDQPKKGRDRHTTPDQPKVQPFTTYFCKRYKTSPLGDRTH